MAHLESMRYRKQPGATAIYDDATVISGMSTGSAAGTPAATPRGDYDDDMATPNNDIG
ncbi:hypothetical protein EC988_005831, partial [Linderina pennispora]